MQTTTYASPAVEAPSPLHPVYALAEAHLNVKETLTRDGMAAGARMNAADARYAMTKLGTGPDHTIGERAIAFGDFSLDQEKQPFQTFMVVTDRRLLGTLSWQGGTVADARYSAIEGIQFQKKMLGISLTARANGAVHDLSFSDVHEPLRAFLRPLYGMAPAQREPVERPLCVPTESDPTGATAALADVSGDAQATRMLRYVRHANGAGLVPVEAARDLVARWTLAHRNRAHGRGHHQARAMSPCSSDDLAQLLVHRHGAPKQHTEQPVRTLVFQSGMRDDRAAAALESVAGLAVASVVGVGWTRRARASVPDFAVMMADTGSFASFRLLVTGTSTPLMRRVPGFVDDMFHELCALEEEMLLRRTVLGWNLPAAALMQQDRAEIMASIERLAGPG